MQRDEEQARAGAEVKRRGEQETVTRRAAKEKAATTSQYTTGQIAAVPAFMPLIPARLTDPSRLRYPLYLSPKVDGVRCSIHPEFGPVTKSGNRIQNPHVREILSDPQL
jgi:hypothetical protein